MRPSTFVAAAALFFAQNGAARSLDAIVKSRLSDSDSPVCVAVGVVGKEMRTTFACSRGADKVAFDADSIFQIGSVTKGLTGLLLADMVVRGEVKIDDPASKHSRPGAKLPTRGGREITLRDLVTHTSGLPRRPAGFAPSDPTNPYGHFDADALYAALAGTTLTRDIGTQYEYSNLGFMWLSEILARRSGRSYGQLLEERILRPLGMHSTSVRPSRAQESRQVGGHDGSYALVPPWSIGENLEGVGLVHSSLADMLKLAEALAGRRSTPLDATIRLALQPPSPRAAPDVAYAWNVRVSGDKRRYDHGGGAGGFVAHVAFDRVHRRAAVVLADAAVSISDLSLHLADAGYHLRRKLEIVPLDPQLRSRYAGSFELDTGTVVKVREDGPRLIAEVAGGLVAELLHQGADAFYVQAVDARVVFTRDPGDRIAALTLYLDGRETRGRRIGP